MEAFLQIELSYGAMEIEEEPIENVGIGNEEQHYGAVKEEFNVHQFIYSFWVATCA